MHPCNEMIVLKRELTGPSVELPRPPDQTHMSATCEQPQDKE